MGGPGGPLNSTSLFSIAREGIVEGALNSSFLLNNSQWPRPHSLYFDQQKMRQHLIECLEKKTPLPFPTLKLQKRGWDVLHTTVVPVFCDCRLRDKGVEFSGAPTKPPLLTVLLIKRVDFGKCLLKPCWGTFSPPTAVLLSLNNFITSYFWLFR